MSHPDLDPVETQEWCESLDSVIATEGPERAQFLLEKLITYSSLSASKPLTTAYKNTLGPEHDGAFQGDPILEDKLRALVRWNAMAMVVKAQKVDPDLGGHIGTFASSAALYDVGFNHFWRAPSPEQEGDMVFIQGHASPGIYARSFLEGRLSEEQLTHFRREVSGKGLSSYPHPWLMPDYWQFPTVSMGLGALQAIYQARFMKYLQARGLIPKSDRKIWCFCGDGEMDEPESLGAIGVAAREQLDNLIFVVNCNLQRLDGPVRGNGKIIQELEGFFRGAGWRVLKVIWGRSWDPLLARDQTGLLQQRMNEVIDGDYQNCKAHGGAYTREHFFGAYPELKKLVEHLSDEDIWHLKRGGHDPVKVFAAYKAAMETKGQPVVILAKTVKGYGMGEAGEARNTAHNTKKLSTEAIRAFRDRFQIPIPDSDLEEIPFFKPDEQAPEMQYLLAKRKKLGGFLPQRRVKSNVQLALPDFTAFAKVIESMAGRSASTTMVFVRLLGALIKDGGIGQYLVPIIPDEARTFGMEGLFRQVGIYSPNGQLYEPVDHDQVMFYKESATGQILEEGINEAGAMASWVAAATSYSTHNCPMIPFYIYYSMFGFQRIGDLAWAAGDSRAKGFLIGGTAGRTTLNGEGLQHQDGHSHLLADTIPNCMTYDPTFGYELAVIIHHGLQRMYRDNQDVYFYITTMNENYEQPAMPEGVEQGIIQGMYLLQKSTYKSKQHVQLLGSGTILRESLAAQALLEADFNVAADVWSVTSFNQLKREAQACYRHNQFHYEETEKVPYVTTCLTKTKGPVIASTDYMKAFAEQIRAFVPNPYYVLGTDGFGRSDSRSTLRAHFEVDRHYIVYTALVGLVEQKALPASVLKQAIEKYAIDVDKPDPLTV